MKILRSTPAVVLFLACSGNATASELLVERLTWAGIKLQAGDTTVLVDAVLTDLWDGAAPEALVPATADTRRRYALITHTHNDHFDAAGLGEVLGERGYVICHESVAAHVASRGFRVISVRTWEPVARGGFVFTAVPAADGFGDFQVSWIITDGERRFLHAGDTLWHGGFDLVGRQFGPFDAVFLPINGARGGANPDIESATVMSPLQAVDAASLLRGRKLVPIHFGFDDPPGYVEVDAPLATLQRAALRRGIVIDHLRPGQRLELAD